MQDVFAHIAYTDLNTFLSYQEALANFHEEITDFYFSKLFWDRPILLEDYDSLPTFSIIPYENRWRLVWLGIGKTLIIASLAFSIGFMKMGNKI